MLPIVNTSWLHQNLLEPELVLLDASLPGTAEGKTAPVVRVTIPGARFLDLKEQFSDSDASFPNTLPSPEQFETACRTLGVNKQSRIVVYDNMGIYASPRVWWMFKAMGHEEVYVLDGGLPEWIKGGYPVEADHRKNFAPGNFKANYQYQMVKTYDEVVENCKAKEFKVVDARSAGRFSGTLPEPRQSLSSGSIPDSFNIPYSQVLDQYKFKSRESLIELFDKIPEKEKPLVFSCGSGLTACIIMMASLLAGKESLALYDGSWTEWATLQGLTVRGTHG